LPEWKKDLFLDRWVVIATERAKRPSDYLAVNTGKINGICPLCEKNESATPPEVLAYRYRDSHRDKPGWWVRVVPNKFPAVRVEGQTQIRNNGIFEIMDGIGAHEVVIETPEHNIDMEDFSEYQIQEIIRAWRDRSLDLRRDSRFKYIQIFKNYGGVAGASLQHPHSQIIATPIVPGDIKEKYEGLKNYARITGRCAICDMIDQEVNDQCRVVFESSSFLCICPFASRFPFEIWIIPKEHQHDYGAIREDQVSDLAYILRNTLKKLSTVLDRPPFNMVISTTPVNNDTENPAYFHWYIEILPRLTTIAGFELGTGCFINPTPPEIAAAELRQIATIYDSRYQNKTEGVENYV